MVAHVDGSSGALAMRVQSVRCGSAESRIPAACGNTGLSDQRAARTSAEVLTLAVGADGGAVVEVITDAGRSHMYQYRRDGALISEATTLHLLAARLEELRWRRDLPIDREKHLAL
jgi:hypothetical protein